MSSSLKQSVLAKIDALRDDLIHISTTIHSNPEIAFQEFKSSALLGGTLEQAGFQVTRGVGGLETAFRADAHGNGDGPTVALLAEYDALPELGHACGHNIMGTAAVGAALAVKSVLAELPGRVVVVGTPAEEDGGGKVILVERGIFNDVDAAMIVHPSGRTMTARGSLASTRLFLEFSGKASHAAAQFSVRAAKHGYAQQVLRRVIQCAEAGAAATGATLKYSTKPSYAELIPNLALAQAFAANWESIGIHVNEARLHERMGSTDMGNVSHVVPAIHPYIKIVGESVGGHTIEFCQASISPEGHQGLIDAAKGMALTTVDLLSDPELMARVKQEFIEQVQKQQVERLGKFE